MKTQSSNVKTKQKPVKKITCQALREKLEEGVAQEYDAYDTGKVVTSIMNDFERQKRDAIYKLCGFSKDSYDNEWRIDHCNGRSGNSPIGEVVVEALKPVLAEWLKKEIPELLHEQLMKRDLFSPIFTYYKEQVKREVTNHVHEWAKQQGKIIFYEMIKPIEEELRKEMLDGE